MNMSAAKSPLINLVIILLVAAVLALLCVPCYVTEGDSASVMSYIFMNTEHDGVTGLLEESNPDFLLNGQVWMPILLFLLGIVTIFMIITKWNLTNSLLFPIVFSVFGMLTVWTNELTRLGGVTLWPTVLMIITIAPASRQKPIRRSQSIRFPPLAQYNPNMLLTLLSSCAMRSTTINITTASPATDESTAISSRPAFCST